jgi:hypothetical protein
MKTARERGVTIVAHPVNRRLVLQSEISCNFRAARVNKRRQTPLVCFCITSDQRRSFTKLGEKSKDSPCRIIAISATLPKPLSACQPR